MFADGAAALAGWLTNIAEFIIPFFLAGGIVYIASLYYWNLDVDAEKYGVNCRETIDEDDSFRGIDSNVEELIVTSDTRTSTARLALKRVKGKATDKPQKIIPTDEISLEERKKAIIWEVCERIPGKNIIDPDLVACLRNYFAYKLALSKEGPESDIPLHFKKRLESYEKQATRVNHLSNPENYDKITLLDDNADHKNAIDDVFMPLARAAEKYCVKPISNVEDQEKQIEICRGVLMYTFWGLYREDLPGINVAEATKRDECINRCRRDIRDEDRIGYWLLTDTIEVEAEFEEFKNIAYNIEKILADYWAEENFTNLHPESESESVTQMDFVSRPFVIYQKELDEFSGGPSHKRIKGKEKYRHKETHR